jgi:LacI family transcriptional regulator
MSVRDMAEAQRVTIGRVAERARVSKMTVSRVINNRPGVAPRLRARVQRVIDALGYVPSARARSLARGRSNVIGLILPDIVSEWTTPLLLGVGEAAEALGFEMLVRTTGRGQTYTTDAPHLLTGSDLAEGVIVNSWRVPAALAQRVARRGGAIVIIDGYARPEGVAWVSADDRTGARTAAQYLASLGHRRIGFVGGGREPYLAQERLAGFREGLAAAGLRAQAGLVRQGNFTREAGYACALRLLRLPEPPTAIFAANDPMAVGVLQAAHELGWRLPEALSVMGFDDTLAAGTYPALTTVARDYKEMGRAAMRLLAAQLGVQFDHELAAPPTRALQLEVPTRLVVRQSTAPPLAGERSSATLTRPTPAPASVKR